MTAIHRSMRIPVGGVELQGDVAIPEHPRGLVVFAHGSGSSRLSPRNRYVADELQSAGLGTVLVDLLTLAEERIDALTAELRFDVELLARRLMALSDWLVAQDFGADVSIGLFGASTGAAAALIAAAGRPDTVAAVVSRGGRPDLAGEALRLVHQPVLLIVGGNDPVVIELNRRAMQLLPGEVQLEIVPGATNLFEEPGALEQVARLARDWFVRHLRPAGSTAADGRREIRADRARRCAWVGRASCPKGATIRPGCGCAMSGV